MAHEVETLAYAGDKPWHGLGTEVPNAMTSAEAIEMGDLDWEVSTYPLRVELPGPEFHDDDDDVMRHHPAGIIDFPEMRVIYRVKDRKPLGVAGPGYQPIQNREGFDFMDGLVATGDVKYEVVGSLKGGKTVFMLARLPQEISVGGGDKVFPYMLLTTSHDGKAACRVLPTTVRVVCNNTLNVAISHTFTKTSMVGPGIAAPEVAGQRKEKDLWVKIHHKGNVMNKLEKARQVLDVVNTTFNNFAAVTNQLAEVAVSEEMIERTFELMGYLKPQVLQLPSPDELVLLPEVTDSAKRRRDMQSIREIFGQEAQNAWGWVNAWTGFLDHGQKVRAVRGRNVADAKFDTLMLGYKAGLKKKAFATITELAGVK